MIHPQIALIFSPHSWSIVNFHFIDWLLLLWSDQSPLLPRQPRPLQRSRTPRVRLVTKVENRSLGLWWPAICKRLIPSTAARRRARRRIGIPPSFSPYLFLSLSSLLSLPPFYPSLHSLSWIRRMWHCSHSLLVSGLFLRRADPWARSERREFKGRSRRSPQLFTLALPDTEGLPQMEHLPHFLITSSKVR